MLQQDHLVDGPVRSHSIHIIYIADARTRDDNGDDIVKVPY